MKIKSNALPHELDSPFYQANKKFCQVFERFIAEKKGKVKGRYNAWSYLIEGIVETNDSWSLKYKRAIYTSTGNLLLSSKYQSLLSLVEWTCTDVKASDATFFIRRKKLLDVLNPSYLKLKQHPKYVMKTNGKRSPFFANVLETLKPLFESKEIYRITLKSNKLTIELRSELHHLDIFDQLTQV